MILFPLYQYLIAPDLAGTSDTESFAAPIELGDTVIENRNDARRYLKEQVGQRFYAGRRLENEGHTAITLQAVSNSPESHLKGDDRQTAVVQAEVFANGINSFVRAAAAAEAIRMAVSYYRGTWGKTVTAFIGTVTVIRSFQRFDAPRDASNYWTVRLSADFEITYLQNLVEV